MLASSDFSYFPFLCRLLATVSLASHFILFSWILFNRFSTDSIFSKIHKMLSSKVWYEGLAEFLNSASRHHKFKKTGSFSSKVPINFTSSASSYLLVRIRSRIALFVLSSTFWQWKLPSREGNNLLDSEPWHSYIPTSSCLLLLTTSFFVQSTSFYIYIGITIFWIISNLLEIIL